MRASTRCRAVVLGGLVLLGGCVGTPAPRPLAGHPPAALEGVKRFELTARIGVRYDGQGFFGGLRWHHGPNDDGLLLLSPLGQGVARIRRDGAGASLTTASQQVFHAADAGSLMEAVLGWRLPLDGLPYWALGEAAPGTSANAQYGDDGRLKTLTQNGWRITYGAFEPVGALSLPESMVLSHGAHLEIRVVDARWSVGG
ncbi:MAG: lipoprotein insertase outer membrane protein LolB [Betaproteobacteria bacterium]|nr:lipoprotein insertase outer membrane protein LolB [Betaproteobacteria bacterium]